MKLLLDTHIALIMVTAGHDIDSPVLRQVDKAMFAGDTPRPETSKVSLKRLGFTCSTEGIKLALIYEFIDFIYNFLIFFLP